MSLGSTNILNLADSGTFAASGEISSKPSDIDALFRELRTQPRAHLVIYVHGGLVNEYAGRVEASRLADTFARVPDAHPLFVLWESGDREIIRRELLRIGSDPLFGRLIRPLMTFLVSKLQVSPHHARGLALPLVSEQDVAGRNEREQQGEVGYSESERTLLTELTPEEEAQFGRLLRGDADLRRSADEIAAHINQAGRGVTPAATSSAFGPLTNAIFEQQKVAAEGESRSTIVVLSALIRPAIRVLGRTITRIKERLDHGIYCTLVEEVLREFYFHKFGTFFWDVMKREVHAAFADNEGRSGVDLHGGTYLIDQLAVYLADPAAPSLKVSLVGHSAGTIFLCALLDYARAKLPHTFKFSQIIFMAPAVNYELCRRSLIDHTNRFENLSLMILDDAAEMCDAIAGPIYPRSLLYFVSGLLEGNTPTPLVGLGRYLIATPPYNDIAIKAVRSFFEHNSGATLIWAIDSEGSQEKPTLQCCARKHGDFPSDPVTLMSLLKLLGGEP